MSYFVGDDTLDTEITATGWKVTVALLQTNRETVVNLRAVLRWDSPTGSRGEAVAHGNAAFQ
jgi:hypothetical protein